MKKLIIINGVPGVGKSAVCSSLYARLDGSVWLDADWCWMMNPFVVTEENKRMVENNSTYLLRNSLTNSSLKYIVFSWVIHREEIFKLLLDRLKDLSFELHKISLVCSEKALKERATKDKRKQEQIEKSLKDMQGYWDMDTIKLDTSELEIYEVVDKILDIIQG